MRQLENTKDKEKIIKTILDGSYTIDEIIVPILSYIFL